MGVSRESGEYQVYVMVEVPRPPLGADALESLAVDAVSWVLGHEGRESGEVSVLFSDDSFISELNERYRDETGPTDVLTFAMEEGQVMAPDDILGDIVVSLETAYREALVAGISLVEEIILLVVHGCLHLVGYDHDEPEKEAVMWKLQTKATNALLAKAAATSSE